VKNSNKILVIAAGTVVAAIIVFALVARSIIAREFPASGPAAEAYVEEQANLKDFIGIRASSVWKLDIVQGEAYAVVVHVVPALRDRLIVRKSGDVLELGWTGGSFTVGPPRLRAEITMPRLESLDLSGAADVRISGFKTPRLEVVSSGAGAVVCRDSTIGDLKIVLSGIGSVDFSAAPCTNADAELSGLGSLKLDMAGGELRGNLSGVGSIEYRGDVSAERINRSGLGSVKHR
jgi:hypothetical protein